MFGDGRCKIHQIIIFIALSGFVVYNRRAKMGVRALKPSKTRDAKIESARRDITDAKRVLAIVTSASNSVDITTRQIFMPLILC